MSETMSASAWSGCARTTMAKREQGASPRGRIHARTIVIGMLLLLHASLAWASEIAAPHRVAEARFSSEGEWFVTRIVSSAPWAHWTLANPARVIVDLGDAVTDLPNAPGLYETPMPEGPIKLLRTSQFMNTGLDRRVRFTFELSQIAVYEARRVGEFIEIRIANARPGAPRTWVLNSAGLTETTLGATPPVPVVGAESVEKASASLALDAGSTVSAPDGGNHTPAHKTGPNSANDVPSTANDARPSTAENAGPDTSAPDADPMAWQGEEGGIGSAASAGASRGRPGSRLLDALAAVFDTSAGETALEGKISHEDPIRSGDTASDSKQEPSGFEDELSEARVSLEQLLGAGNVDHVREVQGKLISDGAVESALRLDQDLLPDSLGFVSVDDYALDQPAEPTEVVRERAARRLLNEAVEAWTSGDAARAQSLGERVRRHYASYPSAQQSLVLEREMHLAAGNTALAANLPAYPVLPDSGVIPRAGFLRFLDEHWKRDQVDQIERLVETWGPFYPGGGWAGATRFALGEHYYQARDLLRAERYLTAIAPQDSLGARALAMRARLRDEAGDKSGALALYAELAKLEPGPYQLRGLARTADLEFQSGNVDSALAAYRQIEASEANAAESPWAIYQIGNCHTLLGDSRAAAQAYEQVEAEYPESYWAESARAQLQSLDWQRDLVRQVEGMQRR